MENNTNIQCKLQFIFFFFLWEYLSLSLPGKNFIIQGAEQKCVQAQEEDELHARQRNNVLPSTQ